ncbi:receptor-type tyrosine-protein phosphatase eta [Brienomyrus brachyistius]|uniref:receptor-type tyrosine-protein phosphatase eta n=1 Tax=Brienomyrus brachyistius TaxID=42636 RepID=UPI0020B2A872|nr:receptor-type tyrosine-protein phosphatase eta [Brienomyrus brachyistius]
MGFMKTLVSSTLDTSVHELRMYKIGLVLLVVCMGCWAERQYYLQGNASNWDDAREYCQLCFKDLASLTAENMALIASCLNGSYWVGLRKNLSVWSVWSNGDPVTFQNWYPGWPAPPKTKQVVINQTQFPPEIPNNSCYIEIEDVCRNFTNYTKFYVYKEESEAPPPVIQEVPIIEDTCVSVMSFGMWQDQNCSELKPYICYEDRFYGQATISNVTLNSSHLSWMAGPGNITNYRVQINGTFQNSSYDSYHTTSLDMPLTNLTPGMLYNVQVFPLKCSRDLNPENISFYTKPDQVLKLAVEEVQTSSVLLFWNRPVGGHSSYTVRVVNNSIVNSTTNESCWITGLLPGGFYEFAVYSEVLDKSIEGDPENISTYTRPSNVKNLHVTSNNETSIGLMWDRPDGNSSGFLVEVAQLSSNQSNSLNISGTTVTLNNLISGTQYQLSVFSLVPDPSLKGENATITTFTNPSPISSLTLNSNESAITASWTHNVGNVESYKLNISISNTTISSGELNTTQTQGTFYNLISAAQYNVTVYAEVGNGMFLSGPVSGVQYTLPVRPGPPNVTFVNGSFVTLTWPIPSQLNPEGTTFLVTYNSTFWKDWGSKTVGSNTTSFDRLRSGTQYKFYVQTVAGKIRSDPVTVNVTTVPILKVLTIMLQCSSNETLFCETDTAKNATFKKLWAALNDNLQTQVQWTLNWNNKTALRP